MGRMKADFSAAEAAKGMVVNVRIRGLNRFRARMWVALQIMRLAVKVGGLLVRQPHEPDGYHLTGLTPIHP